MSGADSRFSWCRRVFGFREQLPGRGRPAWELVELDDDVDASDTCPDGEGDQGEEPAVVGQGEFV